MSELHCALALTPDDCRCRDSKYVQYFIHTQREDDRNSVKLFLALRVSDLLWLFLIQSWQLPVWGVTPVPSF